MTEKPYGTMKDALCEQYGAFVGLVHLNHRLSVAQNWYYKVLGHHGGNSRLQKSEVAPTLRKPTY